MRRIIVLVSLTVFLTSGCASAGQPGPRPHPPAPPVAAAPAATAAVAGPAAGLACKDQRSWGSYLGEDSRGTIGEVVAALEQSGVPLTDTQREAFRAELEPVVKWRLIRFLLLDGDNHNFGTLELGTVKTAAGKPVRIYRTGFTARPDQPGSCFSSLLDAGGVRHVISLYAGAMPTEDLEAAERSAAEAAGATYFTLREAPAQMTSWREDIAEHGDDPAVVRRAMEAVASLINSQILRPGGKPPLGNIHIHCGGGMHRTGMIVGILERCVGGASREQIEIHYKHYIGWRSKDRPGGFEQGNLDFIQAFDCSLLTP